MNEPFPTLDPDTVSGTRGELLLADFAKLFATGEESIGQALRARIEEGDFRYVVLDGNEGKRVLDEVLTRIEGGSFSVAGEAAKGRWEKGWGENLEAFLASGGDLEKLVPKYIRPRQPLRLRQQYVLPVDPAFELNWYEIFRHWFFDTHLAPFDAIYEFGCGSGFNLAELAKANPRRKYVGLDWAQASSQILGAMAERFGWNLEGRVFDFFHPDRSLEVGPNSAFLTIGALEQTGERWEDFLDFVLEKQPARVFHIEPILEWYDPDNPVDHAAIRFHEVRNYWRGYPQRIEALAAAGRAEILKRQRSFFGSLYIEGYSQLIWRPIG
jgi:SAM-dependent methyltransferase